MTDLADPVFSPFPFKSPFSHRDPTRSLSLARITRVLVWKRESRGPANGCINIVPSGLVTGMFDSESVRQNRELDQKRKEQGCGVTNIQVCHIFGESMMQGLKRLRGLADEYLVVNGVHRL